MKKICFLAIISNLVFSNTIYADSHQDALTIYSKMTPGEVNPRLYRAQPGNQSYIGYQPNVPGYALVRHIRTLNIAEKSSQVPFSEVAAYIDPTTVKFDSLSYPNQTQVIEQSFHFDLVSQSKLLERYLNKTLSVGAISGKLISFSDNFALLEDSDGKIHKTEYPSIYPALPNGLITKPTLVWDVLTEQPGNHQVEVSYQTEGMTWWADYVATYNDSENQKGKLDLNAWVSIVNQSGASFKEAKLKLVAGDVKQPRTQNVRHAKMQDTMFAEGAASGFEEKGFFEYHLYTLGRNTNIPNNSTKQIELFSSIHSIPVDKVYVYDGLMQSDKVMVKLEFENDESIGLGMPLPAGRVRVNKEDSADKSLEFIGGDTIEHTPKGEKISLNLGNAFDIKAERISTAFEKITKEVHEEAWKISLKNHKDEAIKVKVVERMNYPEWKIVAHSHDFSEESLQSLLFWVDVPANKQTEVTYRVRYNK